MEAFLFKTQTDQVFPTDRNNATDEKLLSVALFLSVGVNLALFTCRFEAKLR
jgi:hypothetical protein